MSQDPQVATHTAPHEAPHGEGITGFSVEVAASAQHQSFRTSIEYSFGRPVKSTDMAVPHEQAAQYAQQLAVRELNRHLDRVDAEVKQKRQGGQPAPPQPPAQQAPPPQQQAPAQPQGQSFPNAGAAAPQGMAGQGAGQAAAPQWVTGQKPQGQGSHRFVGTASLDSQTFKTMIAQQLAAQGENPDAFAIYDNRPDLEQGNPQWQVAAVKPVEGSPAALNPAMLTQQGKPKSAFFVDFQQDGSVALKATRDYEQHRQAQQMAQQMAGQQQPAAPQAPAPSDDVPF